MPRESTIKIQRSDTAAATPSGLTAGELAVNLWDRKLFVGGTAGSNITFLDAAAHVTTFNGLTGAITFAVPLASASVTGTASFGNEFTVSGVGAVGLTSNYVKSINGATGAITIGTALAWSAITADQTAAINSGYLTNKATVLTLTLPTTAAVGSVIRVSGMNAGGWKIAQNASGVIHFGKTDTTTGTGGYISSTLTRDGVELVCCVANNEWNVVGSVGNITIV